jgi:AcrR family transcriptional regulator
MPRNVDPTERRRRIIAAVVETLGDGGFAKFSLSSVARRMGGSITLITHYFPNREALMRGLLDQVLEDRQEIFEQLDVIDDPGRRLHAALRYFLPVDPESLALERARVALSSHINADPAVAEFFQNLEPAMRAVLQTGLAGYVDGPELEPLIDVMRAWTSGVAISAVEHPEIWTPQRQLRALDVFISSIAMRLLVPAPPAHRDGPARSHPDAQPSPAR